MAKRDAGILVREMRTAIQGTLGARPVTVSELALATGLSPRSLQRRLADQGTSVSMLLDEVRREMAVDALQTTDISMEALAHTLGYRAPATLTRAVKRWTGLTPSRLRRGVQAEVSAEDPVDKVAREVKSAARCPATLGSSRKQ